MIPTGLDAMDAVIMALARAHRDAAIDQSAPEPPGMKVITRPPDCSDAAWKEATEAQQ